MNKTRIDTMKKFSTNDVRYKRLKRYWKLLQKSDKELDVVYFLKRTFFKERLTEWGLVQRMIKEDKILEDTYYIYQRLLSSIQNKDPITLKEALSNIQGDCSSHMKTAITTLLKNFEYTGNALNTNISNGAIEGVNNFIKVIKRVAFGYKSFFHFRNRILICKKLVLPIVRGKTDKVEAA